METTKQEKDVATIDEKTQPTAVEHCEPSAPEGGWGWVVCGGAFVVHFLTVGQHNSAGVVYSALMDKYSTERGETAWVASLASSMMYLFAAVATSFSDRLGSRIVVIAGSIIAAAGLLASSFSTTLQPLYATYGIVWGMGGSFGLFPTLVILTKYFKKRLALASGIALAGASLGTLVYGPMIEWLSTRYGISVTFRILAALQSLMFLSALTFRPLTGASRQEGRRKFDCSVFKNKAFVIWTISLCTFMLVFLVPFVHLVCFAEDKGVSKTKASLLTGFMALGGALGSLIFGFVCDLPQFNRLKVCQVTLLLIGISSSVVTMTTHYEWISLYSFGFGLFDGCYEMLVPVITRDLAGVAKVGPAIGILYCLMAFPKTLGPPMAGLIYDACKQSDVAFYATGAVSTLAAAIMFSLNWVKPGPPKEDEENLLPPSSESTESEITIINRGTREGLLYT